MQFNILENGSGKSQRGFKLTGRGGCLNIKILSYPYRDPHVKDKTVDRLIYDMEIPIPGKTVFILRRDPGSILQINKAAVNARRPVGIKS